VLNTGHQFAPLWMPCSIKGKELVLIEKTSIDGESVAEPFERTDKESKGKVKSRK